MGEVKIIIYSWIF